MANLLLESIDYKIDETDLGVWRRYLYPSGALFQEFTSHARFLGMPMLHYTYGKCPETGKRRVARGFVAVGRLAVGIVAVGQAAAGLIAVGQLGVGLLLGLGQLSTGLAAIGQVAVGLAFAAGQLATANTVIAQLGLGKYVLAQAGTGEHVWSAKIKDPVAIEHFTSLFRRLTSILGPG